MMYFINPVEDVNNRLKIIIAEVIKITQYIEWNLLRKLNKDTFAEMTLGQIIELVRQRELLPENKLNQLHSILKRRNDITHQYFKRLDFEKHNQNLSFLDHQEKYLKNTLSMIQDFNTWLCSL